MPTGRTASASSLEIAARALIPQRCRKRQSNKGSGFGLLAIRERLNWLGGTFQINSKSGQGTCATLTSPMVLPKAADVSSPPTGAAHAPGTTSIGTPSTTVPAGRRIRVLLADDHIVVRDGLDGLLQRLPDVEVVGKAADGRQAVRMAMDLEPDIVVMDVSMPISTGLKRRARSRRSCRVRRSSACPCLMRKAWLRA